MLSPIPFEPGVVVAYRISRWARLRRWLRHIGGAAR